MSDTSSGSDGGLAIWGATALCILYFLVFLRTCYVLVPYLYSWYKRRYGGEASDRSILNADDFQQYGTRSADSRSESDKKSVPILLIRFFEICALFSLTRAVLWGIAINEDWLVHRWARYILLPTAAFLTMLLLIGVSWWRIYVRFVTATQQTHTFWCVSMEVMKRVMDIFPRVLIGCCLVISIGLFIANVDGDDNWEAEVV
ncbi:hypothetical protein DIPPA_28855 [Diplonema papillatum]|nr:hypothetical protein DIPPA_28855 [Diplonema papillatum]